MKNESSKKLLVNFTFDFLFRVVFAKTPLYIKIILD